MRHLVATLALLLGATAQAQGFATNDLTRADTAAKAALGRDFLGRATAERLLYTCPSCPGEPAVSVDIDRQDDGTEARVRSGATTVAGLEALCRIRSPTCRIVALAVAPAVGWVSSYPLGDTAGATAVILRGGDRLVIRSLAADPATARRTIDTLLPVLRARVID